MNQRRAPSPKGRSHTHPYHARGAYTSTPSYSPQPIHTSYPQQSYPPMQPAYAQPSYTVPQPAYANQPHMTGRTPLFESEPRVRYTNTPASTLSSLAPSNTIVIVDGKEYTIPAGYHLVRYQ